MKANAIEVTKVSKSFVRGKAVLRNVSLTIAPGEMVALIGASGSGKSTLIRTIAGLANIDRSSRGSSIQILGATMQKDGRTTNAASRLRSKVGVVFQQFNLVPRLSVLTNVCFGLLGQIPRWRGTLGRFSNDEKKQAMRALTRVGIADQALKRGSELSGGQQQRAAIARTLTQGAEILIADEPIASLDPSSARRVMDILSKLNKDDQHHGPGVVAPSRIRAELLRAHDRAPSWRSRLRWPLKCTDANIPWRTLRCRERRVVPSRHSTPSQLLRGRQRTRNSPPQQQLKPAGQRQLHAASG